MVEDEEIRVVVEDEEILVVGEEEILIVEDEEIVDVEDEAILVAEDEATVFFLIYIMIPEHQRRHRATKMFGPKIFRTEFFARKL